MYDVRVCMDVFVRSLSSSSASEYEAAPAVPLPGAARGGRRRDGGEVGVYLDVGQVVPQPTNSRPRYQLSKGKHYLSVKVRKLLGS